jgi:hypothetical protein
MGSIHLDVVLGVKIKFGHFARQNLLSSCTFSDICSTLSVVLGLELVTAYFLVLKVMNCVFPVQSCRKDNSNKPPAFD